MKKYASGRIIILIVIAVFMITSTSVTAADASSSTTNQWVWSNGKMYYYGNNGKPVIGWHLLKLYRVNEEYWAYFNEKGVYVRSYSKNTRNMWMLADGHRFYFNNKCRPVGAGFNFINNNLYYMDSRGAVRIGTFKAHDGWTYRTDRYGRIGGIALYRYRYGTFVMVDISDQKLYYYVNGKNYLKADVVTGTKGRYDTPTGVYTLRSKNKNIYLTGPTWRSFVRYWMAFIGSSYGMHDASWRTSAQFSNHRIYLRDGSHGCVNMRQQDAEKLYSRISRGTVVIVQQ